MKILAIILASWLISGCVTFKHCTMWETVPTGLDCIEESPHLLNPNGQDVCNGHTVCKRCITWEDVYIPRPFTTPINACQNSRN